VKDFLEIPEVKSQLFRYADWQEYDIPLAFCKALVSSYEQGISIMRNLDRCMMISGFMHYAAQYELQSGKACTGLMYKLDSVLCSQRLSISRDDGPGHWIRAILRPCHSDFEIPEVHALLFCATIYHAHVFVEQELASSTSQDAIVTLNALLRALVLSCYKEQDLIDSSSKSDAIRFVCNKGADPNEIVRTTVSCTADHKTTTLTWTIWELYLDNGILKCENVNHPGRTSPLALGRAPRVIIQLIESGADLNCKVPMGCKSLQQAIEKRVEAESPTGLVLSNTAETRDGFMKRIKAALLRRGYVWVETDGET
jgi:hypothetical protein